MEDLCEECGCELRVTGQRKVVVNDDTPQKPTELYTVLSLCCENPACGQYQKEIEFPVRERVDSQKAEEPDAQN